ncbi:uncharacterized protein (TIGR00369 family) [Rhodococcus sp. 27YEA15]|uniref:PaaI family thioesterase n=1 Tax=Rhodococcus sp. 27YEA15 TaxID=3156259 RepID=UPI003C7EA650
MSIDTTATHAHPLNTLMDVRVVSVAPGNLTFSQEVGTRFHDHRGRTVFGSLGVMLDGAVGGAVYTGLQTGRQSVIAQVTLAAAADMRSDGSVAATGTLVHLDDGVGLASGELRGEDGALLGVIAGRAMVVSRPPTVDHDTYVNGEALSVPESEPVSDLDGLSGSDIVDGILGGTVRRGPLAGLLDFTITSASDGSVVGELAPVQWMANPFGAVQGGVLISIVDVATGFLAQTLTSDRQDYRILDHKIDFLRSPNIDGPRLRAEAHLLRAGRRLALVESRLVDASGQVYVRSTSSVQMITRHSAHLRAESDHA